MTRETLAGAVTIRLAGAADLAPLLDVVRAYHEFEGVALDDETRRAALLPLLEAGGAFGRVWLLEEGGRTVGYAAICFGYSIEFAGRDAFLDELFIAASHRGGGLGRRALEHVRAEAQRLGLRALHLEVARENERARRLYRSLGFESREHFHLMSCKFAD